MCLQYLVKLKARVFMKISVLEKLNLKLKISDHELSKHYFHMSEELIKVVFSAA